MSAGFAEYFSRLYEDTGLNFVIFYERYEAERFAAAVGVSLKLISACLAFSVIAGVVGAWAQGAKSAAVRAAVAGYVQAFRNTPPLVQLLFFYFALGHYTPTVDAGGWQEPVIGSFGWAVISLGLYAGAFNVEIFRAGIEAVPASTRDAAESLGYGRLAAYLRVILPLALRISLPALSSNLINLLKTTTLAYAIAVPEMMYTMNQIWSDNVNVPEMMLVLFIYYIGLVGVLAFLLHALERRLRVPGIGG
jgi:polar amino acid transport system permease protein